MRFTIELPRSVQKGLARLPRQDQARLLQAIHSLSQEPRPPGAISLQGRNHRLHRIRVGPYRVIYHIKDEILKIMVVRVDHRKQAYRNLPTAS